MSTAGAAVVALAFGLWVGSGWSGSLLAVPDVAWGLGAFRLVVDLSVVGTCGLLVTSLLLREGTGGGLGETARRCLRGATWAALAWAMALVVILVLTWSEVTGLEVSRLPLTELVTGAQLPETVPNLSSALLAVVIAVATRITHTVRGAALLLLLAAYNVLPLTTQGHGAHSTLAAVALTVHVLAMSLWAGGLIGLVRYARRSPDVLATAVPRFSTLALACFLAVAASGATVAWVTLGSLSELWGSRYGLLVLCKLAALAALGTFGWWQRRHAVRAVTRRRPGAFLRLAVAEIAVMATAIALGAALSRAPAPAPMSPGPLPHAAAQR